MRTLNELLIESPRQHPALCVQISFSLLCLVIALGGLAFDHRLIAGEIGWIKPCKFSISLFVYGLTLVWFSQFLTRHARLFRRISIAALVGTVIELSVIILQVVRGTTSHFNTSTLTNHLLFWAAIAAIVPISGGIVVSYVLLLREKTLPDVLGSALRWGLFLTIVGFVPGLLMILPDSFQDAITMYKQFDGHTVGFPEGGPGLPLVGWSTIAGDLRIAHFVGIHAFQVLPAIAWLVLATLPRLQSNRQRRLIWIAGCLYLGLIALLTGQALSAESIVSPSLRTLLFASLMWLAAAIAAALVIWSPANNQAGRLPILPDEAA